MKEYAERLAAALIWISVSLIVIVIGALLTSLISAQAPPAVAGSAFQWTQPAPDAATAQAYIYRYYVDGSTTGVVATGVTCTGTATITCEGLVPALTPGNHSVSLTASAGAAAKESDKSIPPFSFSYELVAAVPLNLRLK
jgi:uncharacterized MnhB-related membrane protein